MNPTLTAPELDGAELRRWAVTPGGAGVQLEFQGSDGASRRMLLSLDDLSRLLMTLPRMLQDALDARCPDGSLRVVQPLGGWRIEQHEGPDGLILRLGTPDGFEVAFAVDRDDAGSLGAALLTHQRDIPPAPPRRPH